MFPIPAPLVCCTCTHVRCAGGGESRAWPLDIRPRVNAYVHMCVCVLCASRAFTMCVCVCACICWRAHVRAHRAYMCVYIYPWPSRSRIGSTTTIPTTSSFRVPLAFYRRRIPSRRPVTMEDHDSTCKSPVVWSLGGLKSGNKLNSNIIVVV